MAKNLVIVESPAKAKTIEKFLGEDFTVKSSFGHIRDLKKGDDAILIDDNFTPVYQVPADKKNVVSELKKLAKKAETVWLASDEDREGEAISWHLYEVLELKEESTKRIVFNEITKTAIQNAIENPRSIDRHLVDAQQARRVLDRLVGYELSPILWRKVKPSLSAGRVQSVAVRLIVEREKEIQAFDSVSDFRVSVFLNKENENALIKATTVGNFKTADETESFLTNCLNAEFTVSSLDVKETQRKAAPPFTTSTLQQEASRKLGYSVSKTMLLAQKLYEAGHITYMRTDSVNLSNQALGAAKESIVSEYGEEYSQVRNYKNKNASAQEAHEAIRPSFFNKRNVGGDSQEQRLYELIWKRTVASQMSNAKLEKTLVKINVSNSDTGLKAEGEVITFPGFLKLYLEGKDDEDEENNEGLLPPLSVSERLNLNNLEARERFSRAPARYTEASLVRKLEELGIGRPSTYAPTISTIQKREYVVKESREGIERKYESFSMGDSAIVKETKTEIAGADKNKLFPTDIGTIVTNFLIEHFGGIMEYSFTASVEKEFDNIAKGMNKWEKMIDKFYHPFHKTVETTMEVAEKATGSRELGTDPKSGKPIIARIGRFGPMIQIGTVDDEEKPRFASLQPGQSIETITFEEAMKLFEMPKVLGDYKGTPISVAIGRFGPYVKHEKVFASIAKDEDPLEVSLERAIEIMEAKLAADANRIIKTFDEDPEIQVLNGRYGPYISYKKKNYRIPKDTDPKSLSLDMVREIIEKAPAKGKGKAKGKAKAKSSTKKK
jgi:DNA topoisomerase-1